MPDSARFRDTQETLADFTDNILVVCPRCDGCATVKPSDALRADLFAPRRATCLACGYIDERQTDVARFGDACDSYFGLPLWLQTPVGDQILWAYNERHLGLIEAYVRATLRERRARPESGWKNASVISRLPGWVKDAKNRAQILKAIERMRAKARD